MPVLRNKQTKLEMPRRRGRAVVRHPGEKTPWPDMIPAATTPGIAIGIRADERTLRAINRYLDRLEAAYPGLQISVTDAFRSLIRRGGEVTTPVTIPVLVGESAEISFMADGAAIDGINAEIGDMADANPGESISKSVAIRSLVQRGAAAFAEDDA